MRAACMPLRPVVPAQTNVTAIRLHENHLSRHRHCGGLRRCEPLQHCHVEERDAVLGLAQRCGQGIMMPSPAYTRHTPPPHPHPTHTPPQTTQRAWRRADPLVAMPPAALCGNGVHHRMSVGVTKAAVPCCGCMYPVPWRVSPCSLYLCPHNLSLQWGCAVSQHSLCRLPLQIMAAWSGPLLAWHA